MKCDYEEIEIFDEVRQKFVRLYRPTFRVTLIKRGFRLFPISCLLDSGADMIIFPGEVGRLLHITYKKFPAIKSITAGGGITHLYRVPFKDHQIRLFVDDVQIEETIHFSEGQRTPLLGQDFFKHFRIIFERGRRQFYLESA